MARFCLSNQAERDIESILAWTHEQFGEQGRLRYEALLIRAVLDVANESQSIGCVLRPELAAGAFTYHIRLSRNRVTRAAGRVRSPRHFLLCRFAADGCLQIGRVLHDSMDFA